MPLNKGKLIEILISNLANAIVHEILEQAIKEEELTSKYRSEVLNSYSIAKVYRQKINPIDKSLSVIDQKYICSKLESKARKELLSRINKGYTGINQELIPKIIDKFLKELNIK